MIPNDSVFPVTPTDAEPATESSLRELELIASGKEIGLASLSIAHSLLNGTRLDDPGVRNSLREFHAGLGLVLAELAAADIGTLPPSPPLSTEDIG